MTAPAKPKSLSIVIPALNEEDAIGTTISRCLDARAHIKQKSGLDHVEIIVVNDGSTDRTAEIAESFTEITLINFEKNQGYGAALKRGFKEGTGDFLGFLDGDGTCDPLFFSSLCQAAINGPADLVTGSRMHKKSKMPLVRRVGNLFYAQLMSYLSGCKIDDTASGMRVIKRAALPELSPLPDGLHFTPSMTCRALFSPNIVLKEVEMPYHERQGLSKLSVFKDGIRFLLAIMDIALTYCPLIFFGRTGSVFLLIAMLYGITPFYSSFINHTLPDSFIYRLITINTLILAALTFFSVGIVAERIAATLNGHKRTYSWLEELLLSTLSSKKLIIAGPFLIFSGILLNIGPLQNYLTTHQINYHWGYISTGALLVLSGLQLSALGVFERLLDLSIRTLQSKNNHLE